MKNGENSEKMHNLTWKNSLFLSAQFWHLSNLARTSSARNFYFFRRERGKENSSSHNSSDC